MNRESGGMILVAFCVIFVIIALLPSAGNLTGKSQKTATEQARKWANTAYPGATVDCSGGDSDGDGYVTCTVFPQGDDKRAPISIQCAGAYTLRQEGCKLTNLLLNAPGRPQ